jgi:hypothetical protein
VAPFQNDVHQLSKIAATADYVTFGFSALSKFLTSDLTNIME